jgi:hypothetical protein
MAKYRLTGPDGGTYEISAPDDVPESEIQAYAEQHFAKEAAPREKTGALSALGQGAAQGVTFGFADELYGLGRGAIDAATSDDSFTDAYAKHRDTARTNLDQAREDQPLAAYGGELASGVAIPGGVLAKATGLAFKAKKASTFGQRMKQAAKEGALLGGVYGFGAGEGDVGDQLTSTAGGALGGAAFGAAMPGVVDLSRGLARMVTTPIRAARDKTGFAAEKTLQNIGRDAGDSTSLEGLNKSLADFDRRVRLKGKADPTMTVGDLGGEAYQGLQRSAFDTPNDQAQIFKRSLQRRQGNQWRRIEDEMSSTLANPDEYKGSLDAVIARRKANADADFGAARAVPTPMTPQLKNVFERPLVKSLLSQSEDIQSLMNQPIGFETRTDMVHILKEHMDSLIQGYQRAWKMGTEPTAGIKLKAWTQAKNDLLNAIDNPAYKKALDNFAGDSALKTAAQRGLDDALDMPPEELAPLIKSMSASEQDMFRLGAARAIAADIERSRVGLNRTEYFNSPDMKKRMLALWGDSKSYLKFRRMLEREGRKFGTLQSMVGNSKTNKFQKFSEDSGDAATLTADALDVMGGVARLSPTSVLRGAANIGKRFMGMSPEVSAEILRLAQRPAAQGLDPALQAAIPRVAARSDPNKYDELMKAGRGAFAAGYGSWDE